MKKILLVEDCKSIVKGLKYALEQEQFKIITADSLSNVEKLLDEHFHIAILDVMLPDGTSFDLCNYLKKEKEVPRLLKK